MITALDLFDRRTDMLERRNDLLVEVAEAHVYDGNTKRAFELLDRAVRVPDWYRWIRAWARFNARDYKAAVDEINKMHKCVGDAGYVPDIQLLLAASYSYLGNQKRADPRAEQSQERPAGLDDQPGAGPQSLHQSGRPRALGRRHEARRFRLDAPPRQAPTRSARPGRAADELQKLSRR